MKRQKVYLSGSMQYESDNQWWAEATEMLKQLGYDVFNPMEHDTYLKGLFNLTNQKKLYGLKDDKLKSRIKNFMSEAATRDMYELEHNTDLMVVHWTEGVAGKGAGTKGEITYFGYTCKKPIYIVLGDGLTEDDVSLWVQAWTTKIFNSFDELKEYLIQQKALAKTKTVKEETIGERIE